MTQKTIEINGKRLEKTIFELGELGLNEQGGLDRTTFTEAELEARQWLKNQLSALDMHVSVDQAANIWGRRNGSEALPSIVFGSHIDTVPNGGKYDGALGVLMALEVMRVLEENQIETRHPLELISFSAEEPNPFGLSTFGSRAISRKLTKEDLVGVTDVNGTLLTDALQEAGGDPVRFDHCARKPETLKAYVEVHIEQGKRLINNEVAVGVVTGITGIYREEVRIRGVANHAGTTLMGDRVDALVAGATLVMALEEICSAYSEKDVVGTVGKLDVYPNAANIIPGEVVFLVEIRGADPEDISAVRQRFEQKKTDLKEERDVDVQTKLILDQAPVHMSKNVMQVSEQEAEKLGISTMQLTSMAGHDAAHMASLTQAGMLFVPSIDGKSHCPEERSKLEDIVKVANVLLKTILALDKLD